VNLPPGHRFHFGDRSRDGKRCEWTERFITRARVWTAVAVCLFACLDSSRASLTPSPVVSWLFGFTIYSLLIADLVAELQREAGLAMRFAPEWGRIFLLPAVAHELLRIIQEDLVNVTKYSEAKVVLIRSRAEGPTSLRGSLGGQPAVESKPGRGACLEIVLPREACG
jgi:hypothetical protein